MNDKIKDAVDWITNGNMETFKADFDSVTGAVPGLTDSDLETLRKIHANGLVAFESTQEVSGHRSYGWADQRTK